MPIRKRLTSEQRIQKALPRGWKRALTHPLLQSICHGDHFDPTPINVSTAIALVKAFRGATYEQKVFVLALDIIMEKGLNNPILTPDAYNRLQEQLVSSEEKMEFWPRHHFLWDIYHDSHNLLNVDAGGLVLPTLRPRSVKRIKKIKKRRRLIKKGK